LPAEVAERFRAEIRSRSRILRLRLGRDLTEQESRQIRWKLAGQLERYLDNAHGECLLRQPQLATIVQETLLFFDEQHFRLDAWCVMPNHVHVVVTPYAGYELASILLSWKTHSAKMINKAVGRRGRFWQREYYDRLIRHQAAFDGIVSYVLKNPIKAGIPNWKFFGTSANVVAQEGQVIA